MTHRQKLEAQATTLKSSTEHVQAAAYPILDSAEPNSAVPTPSELDAARASESRSETQGGPSDLEPCAERVLGRL